MRRMIGGVAVALALAACTSDENAPRGSSTPPASPPPTPLIEQTESQVLAAVADAAQAMGSVHTEASLKQGSKTARVVNDTGAESGRQLITIGSQRVEIRLVAKMVYVRANEEGLRDFFQFPASVAAEYADEWISFTESDPGYGDLAETLDMPSLLENITLVGTLSKEATTIGGTSVIGISGEHPQGGTATLYVAATGDPLPVRMDLRSEDQGSGSITFSNWGKAVSVSGPSSAVPFADLAA